MQIRVVPVPFVLVPEQNGPLIRIPNPWKPLNSSFQGNLDKIMQIYANLSQVGLQVFLVEAARRRGRRS